LFWEKGVHATSLKDLEAALKMKPGSIYAAFTSKENLYLLALERYFEKSRKGFRDQIARAASPLSGLAAHFRAYTLLASKDVARQACMLTKTLVDTSTTEPTIADQTRSYLIAMQQEFSEVFKRAQVAEEVDPSAEPDRLARRFQANLSALRLELHLGTEPNKRLSLPKIWRRKLNNYGCVQQPSS
jgi:AcrR family transcriptional regulator